MLSNDTVDIGLVGIENEGFSGGNSVDICNLSRNIRINSFDAHILGNTYPIVSNYLVLGKLHFQLC